MRSFCFIVLGLFVCASIAYAEEVSQQPKPIPKTRPEEKAALDILKKRQPRLPLPPPTAEEIAAASGGPLGGGIVNNVRMRALHLPADLRGSSGGNSRQRDPNMTLDNTFTVELFWIASRTNNCHYCLGHQEVKLRSAGVPEERVAALDCDWSRFTDTERAAYAFARKLTLEPHLVEDADIATVAKYYEPLQVLEIVYFVSRYNATNRWTDSLGIPQEDRRELLTATPDEFQARTTIVAPLSLPDRGPLPSPEEALMQLTNCQARKSRLPVLTETQARETIPDGLPSGKLPQWIRLVANFPVAGRSIVETRIALQEKGLLSPELKAEIDWTAARHDRAWYALGHAAKRLESLGYSQDSMFALDHPEAGQSEPKRAVLELTAKLTASPQAITDADIASVRKHFSNSEVAEIVYRITQAAMFDRLTEAASLPLESE